MELIQTSDIHNHLLPGVDDGFRDPADSLAAMSKMAEFGCTDFVFTPHMNPDVFPDMTEARHREVYDEFCSHLPRIPAVTTHLAAEYMVVKGFEQRVSSRADELHIFPDRSILIEMSYYYRSQNLEQTLFELNMAGLKPILAHPERYLYMADSLGDFDKIVGMGCRLQLNLMSLTGQYGRESMKILDHLLSHGMYSFMATDLHSLAQLDRILDFKPGFFLKRKLRKCFEL